MKTITKQRLIQQGFVDIDDETLESVAPWLRLAPSLCALVALIGTAAESWLVLWALVPAGVIGAVTSKHPFDRLYDEWVQPLMLGRGERLPDCGAPRRFSCGLAAAWLFATGLAFLEGWIRTGVVLGATVAGPLALTALTDICLGCIAYHRLRCLAGLSPWTRRSSAPRTSTAPRISALRSRSRAGNRIGVSHH